MANNPSAPDSKGGNKAPFERELKMPPIPDTYAGSGKLKDKVAVITGGDSGIGRSVALFFAREGASVMIAYNEADVDAAETVALIEAEGRPGKSFKGDLSREDVCQALIKETVEAFGRLDILVNNAANHQEDHRIQDITREQLEQTFATNVHSYFYCTKAAMDHLSESASIINTASVVAYRGSEHLLDYAATKGAVVSFTRSLALNLAEKRIRVNGVAPGPIWTPLVVHSFDADHLSKFGKDTPLGRAGYPYELGAAYVYLASADSSYTTGQFIHINGGDSVIS